MPVTSMAIAACSASRPAMYSTAAASPSAAATYGVGDIVILLHPLSL